MTHPTTAPITADPLALLRTRTSSKWSAYPADVLPMFVAEMDFPLAPQIAARLVGLIARSDTGYQANRLQVGEAFAGYAGDTWDWRIDPSTVQTTTNVVVALTELVRAAIEPGDRVLLNSPVYFPFTTLIQEAGGEIVDAPLAHIDGEWSLDLDAIEAAYAGGVRVHVLCHPHNPIGVAHPREVLERLAELAAAHGVLVLSDEIHGPLAHADAAFVPYLAISDAARATGVTVTSASKAFNVPGLGCAFWVPGSDTVAERLSRVPESVRHRVGQFGAHATIAGFSESRDWLAGVVAAIESNRRLLRELLTEHLPEVVLAEPRAGYLAWLDFRPLGWGDDPAKRVLERGRVALSAGRAFGKKTGRGFARINFACAPDVLEEGVRRIAAAR
jgi:cystathionine beta-lyase